MKKSFGCLISLFFFLSCSSTFVCFADVSVTSALEEDVFIADEDTGVSSNMMAKKISLVKASDEYRLGAGDKIKIHIFRQSDLDVEVRLGASGDIRYPFLGKIHVIGMTLPDLERKITQELSDGYLVDPQVRVSMEEFRPFYVNGEVKAPGAYPFQSGLTVRKAISLAGGFTSDADKHEIFLIQARGVYNAKLMVSLSQRMEPGDILTIKKSFFYVNGEVKNPGKYSYQSGLTVRKAISLAGGLTTDADKHKMFIIQPTGDVDSSEIKVLMNKIMSSGDILTIKKSFFYVNGEVKSPGKFSYQAGMTYRMAIAMAGGLKEKADDNKVYVVHEGEKLKRLHVNNLNIKIKPGDVIIAEEGFF